MWRMEAQTAFFRSRSSGSNQSTIDRKSITTTTTNETLIDCELWLFGHVTTHEPIDPILRHRNHILMSFFCRNKANRTVEVNEITPAVQWIGPTGCSVRSFFWHVTLHLVIPNPSSTTFTCIYCWILCSSSEQSSLLRLIDNNNSNILSLYLHCLEHQTAPQVRY